MRTLPVECAQSEFEPPRERSSENREIAVAKNFPPGPGQQQQPHSISARVCVCVFVRARVSVCVRGFCVEVQNRPEEQEAHISREQSGTRWPQ